MDSEKPSPITTSLEAAKGLVEAIPVYPDAIQPAAKEVGTALQTIAKSVHVALAPLSVLVWGYDRIKDYLERRLAEKLRDVPPETIQTPPINLAGPALEALRFAGHDPDLRELYATLLATAMDADRARMAHPSFVDVLKSLTPDEAKILRLFITKDSLPVIDILAKEKGGTGYKEAEISFSLIGEQAGCVAPELAPSYLDNLERMGLISRPYRLHLTAPGTYEPIEAHRRVDMFRKIISDMDRELRIDRRLVRRTSFGEQFIKACIGPLHVDQAAPTTEDAT